ncbi:hypothetical protein ACFQ0E_10055 [Lysobacter brunescens]|uniref:Secreted protein n=2 Tax=Lysobacter brunescens TaxID=262323 RepID=A0ABW2YD76_9GAMM
MSMTLMSLRAPCTGLCLALACLPVLAQAPEIRREPYPPQAVGSAHTIRIIPETCAYLRGMFTTDPAVPYRYGASKTAGRCQPRARLVDPAKAMPSAAKGWILNDEVRIPQAGCPSRTAVIRIWRKPIDTKAPLDGRGQARIYLQDAKQQAQSGAVAKLPEYAAVLEMVGQGCGGAAG